VNFILFSSYPTDDDRGTVLCLETRITYKRAQLPSLGRTSTTTLNNSSIQVNLNFLRLLLIVHALLLSSSDPDGQPPLSAEQRRVSAVWLRPVQAGYTSDIGTRIIHPQEILQHIVTDCSVCASISVCLEHARRFGSDVRPVPVVKNVG
jgi:hypothetical protein